MMARSALLVLALALVASAAGCKTVANGDLFEDKIEKTLVELKQIKSEVDCPDRIPLGMVENNHFRCDITLVASGEHGVLEVKLDAAGSLSWMPVSAAPSAPPDLDPGE